MRLALKTSDLSRIPSPRGLFITLMSAVVAAALVVGGIAVVNAVNKPEFHIRGIPDNGVLNAAALSEAPPAVAAAAEGSEGSQGSEGGKDGEGGDVDEDDKAALRDAEVRLNGETVETRWHGGSRVLDVGSLPDGDYELTVTADSGMLSGGTELSRRFTVDTTPPQLDVPDVESDSLSGPVAIKGTATGAAQVTVNEQPAKLGKKGSFTAELERIPGSVRVVATDEAGNETQDEVKLSVRRPMLRAVHVSAHGWASDQLREPVLKLLRDGKLNAVQLDIKDESGVIGYDSKLPLAKKIGAAKGIYDAKQAIEEIHEAGGEVVGRIVAFRDPILASASWKGGNRDRVVQTSSGGPYGAGSSYGAMSFTNFASPEVRKYHIDLAAEAAKLGFDDILYDYIRRPDGKLSGMRFPGLGSTTPEDSIAELVGETRTEVRKHGAFLGVSVFGIAVDRPLEIAQDIGKLSEVSDYIAPMVYPSHWNKGEYGVADPNSQPYSITKRSLADFKKQVKGTHAEIIPWLQDFSLGVSYGDREVAAQIKAAADVGIDSFLLWNPAVRYHHGALKLMG